MKMHIPCLPAVGRRIALALAAAGLLTLGLASPAHPWAGLDWSPSGKTLAFWCDSGLHWASLTQGGVTRLASSPTPARCSPDGAQVAWSDRDGTYVCREGAGPVRVAEPGRVADWSPDSQWLVVEAWTPGGSPDIVAARAGGGGVVPLAADPAWDGSATCSPDGRWIAFVSMRNAKRSDIWVVGWDGSHLSRVTSMFEATEPCWSPDGSRLAFTAKETEESPTQIYCVDFGTRKVRQLTRDANAAAHGPHFVGLAHVAYTAAGPMLIGLEKGDVRRLPSGALSPDGRRIALLSGSPGALEVVSVDGRNRRTMDQGVEAFAWSPDGRWLGYLALTNGPANTPVRELRVTCLDAKGVYSLWSEGLTRNR